MRTWVAQIMVNGKNRYLGSFHDEELAAEAYDAGAREAWGEHARLNFPDESTGTASSKSSDAVRRAAKFADVVEDVRQASIAPCERCHAGIAAFLNRHCPARPVRYLWFGTSMGGLGFHDPWR